MTNAPVSLKKQRSPLGWFNRPSVVPYMFILPFALYFLLVYLYPFISTIIMSFQRIEGPTTPAAFIGFTNFQRMLQRNYYAAIENTTRYAFWDLIILVPVPLFFAVLLRSSVVKFPSFFKSIFFVPALTSIIVAGIVFRLAFGTLDVSLANRIIGLFGYPPRKWLANAYTGNFVLVLLTLWRWLGVNIVYYYSGLQTIPGELYEAAQIDGANAAQQFAHITLPGIKPVIIYVTTLTVLGGFSMFTESVALWEQSYPGGTGLTIVGFMYMMGFFKNNMGMASAVGLTLLALILVVNMIQLLLMGFFRKEA